MGTFIWKITYEKPTHKFKETRCSAALFKRCFPFVAFLVQGDAGLSAQAVTPARLTHLDGTSTPVSATRWPWTPPTLRPAAAYNTSAEGRQPRLSLPTSIKLGSYLSICTQKCSLWEDWADIARNPAQPSSGQITCSIKWRCWTMHNVIHRSRRVNASVQQPHS